jgi:F0F1-type ATP synthase membrane subunit c/vacuolar-type H+-ATPase subunit K
MMMWMAFGAALGMAVGALINNYEIGISVGLAISALCCAGDLLLKAWRNKQRSRLSWFE